MPRGFVYDPATHEVRMLSMPTEAVIAANTPDGWIFVETDMTEHEFRHEQFGEPMEN